MVWDDGMVDVDVDVDVDVLYGDPEDKKSRVVIINQQASATRTSLVRGQSRHPSTSTSTQPFPRHSSHSPDQK